MGKYSEAVIRMKDYERTPEDEQAEIARLKLKGHIVGKYSEAVIRMKDYERTPEDEQAEIARLKMIAERNKKILNNLKKNSIQK